MRNTYPYRMTPCMRVKYLSQLQQLYWMKRELGNYSASWLVRASTHPKDRQYTPSDRQYTPSDRQYTLSDHQYMLSDCYAVMGSDVKRLRTEIRDCEQVAAVTSLRITHDVLLYELSAYRI